MNITHLHNYQVAAYKHILKNPYCGLFLDMGLGKTVTTLTAINILLNEEVEILSALVVAPKRVAENVWSDEIRQWSHLKGLRISIIAGDAKQRTSAMKAKADIYIVSRDNFAWLCGQYGGHALPYDMLVIDELSSFKSHQSQRFKAARTVRPSFKRVVGLTGTPAPNGLIDLWAQMFLIDRGQRLGKTITGYRQNFFRPDKQNGAIVYSYKLLDDSDKAIHERIADVCISMKAEDYLDMPERIDNFVDAVLSPAERKAYKEFEKESVLELFAEGVEITAANAAALTNKLLQYANGAVYDEDRNVHEVHSEKLDALEELVEAANGRPVLVAWSYRHDLARIKKRLKAYNPRELKDGKDIDDWNKGKIQVLLAHPASAGHGLNLQKGGSTIIWFGLTWSLELYQQFNGRLYRQGQKESVVIHHIITKGTADEDVLAALRSKDIKQARLMEAVKARIQQYIHK